MFGFKFDFSTLHVPLQQGAALARAVAGAVLQRAARLLLQEVLRGQGKAVQVDIILTLG